MTDTNRRMTNPDQPPAEAEVEAWIGKHACKYWKRIVQLIEERYPDIFVPEWLFGGGKHGWSLRYKKSKSFCTLIPEKNRLAILIVFGADQRAKVEAIRKELSPATRREYDQATTYHDGKWLLITVDSERVIKDIRQLLAIKRKPASAKCVDTLRRLT
ncbi:MAG: DUF3788 domain-containing protein [Deltaproteobacteria bacterium]|nr:DUF3788 domain-containing protein [Deltaproteobacteria bacterium]